MLSIDDIFVIPKAFFKIVEIIILMGFSSPLQLYSIVVVGLGFIVFFLLCTPVPFVNSIGQFFVHLLGFKVVRGMSCLITIGVVSLVIFALKMVEYHWTFQSGATCRELATEDLRKGCMASRWRKERDLYLTATGAVLFLSLNKISGMLREKQKTD